MTRFLETLLLSHLQAFGLADAKTRARLIADDFDRRDEMIYDYRAHHSEKETAKQYGIAPRTVRHIVRAQMLLRRPASR